MHASRDFFKGHVTISHCFSHWQKLLQYQNMQTAMNRNKQKLTTAGESRTGRELAEIAMAACQGRLMGV